MRASPWGEDRNQESSAPMEIGILLNSRLPKGCPRSRNCLPYYKGQEGRPHDRDVMVYLRKGCLVASLKTIHGVAFEYFWRDVLEMYI